MLVGWQYCLWKHLALWPYRSRETRSDLTDIHWEFVIYYFKRQNDRSWPNISFGWESDALTIYPPMTIAPAKIYIKYFIHDHNNIKLFWKPVGLMFVKFRHYIWRLSFSVGYSESNNYTFCSFSEKWFCQSTHYPYKQITRQETNCLVDILDKDIQTRRFLKFWWQYIKCTYVFHKSSVFWDDWI